MTDAEPTPRTPEQQDAVRRRSRTLSMCGLICGVAGLAMLLGWTSDQPPSIFGVNLSFCAIMIGIGLVFYMKETPGVAIARAASATAIFLGIFGTLLFVFQGVHFRKEGEEHELDRVAKIVKSANVYAHDHDADFPNSLTKMLLDRYLTLDDLLSSYATLQKPSDRERLKAELAALQQFSLIEPMLPTDGNLLIDPMRLDFEKNIEENADYQYFGAGLSLAGMTGKAALSEEIIVAASRYAINRTEMTVGFANGTAEYLNLENAESALRQSNEARAALGFQPIRPPELIQRAQQYKTAPSAPRD